MKIRWYFFWFAYLIISSSYGTISIKKILCKLYLILFKISIVALLLEHSRIVHFNRQIADPHIVSFSKIKITFLIRYALFYFSQTTRNSIKSVHL